MKKNLPMKISKLIALAGISFGSAVFSPARGQEKDVTEKLTNSPDPGASTKQLEQGQYEIGGRKYGYKYEKVAGDGRIFRRYLNLNKDGSVSDASDVIWVSPKQNNSSTSNPTPYIPPQIPSKSNFGKDLGNALVIGSATVGTLYLISELIESSRRKKQSRAYYQNYVPPVVPKSSPTSTRPDWWNEKDNWLNESVPDVKKATGKQIEDFFKEDNEKSVTKEMNKDFEEKMNLFFEEKENAKETAKTHSKELSDFVERQMVLYSPETKVWFDSEVKKANEFYMKSCEDNIFPDETCKSIMQSDDLHKVIAFRAYQAAREKPVIGEVMMSVEAIEKIRAAGVENFYNDEIEKAEEFYEQHGVPKGKPIPRDNYKIVGQGYKGNYTINSNVNANVQIDERIEKLIGYYVYNAAKRYTKAGKVIEKVEEYDEVKEKIKNFYDE